MNFVEYVIISINQLESRGRASIKKIINLYIIAAQNSKDCGCFLYKQQVLWLAHRLRDSISGDVEENPRPFIQINNDKNAPCVKQVNSVSLLESKLSELGRIPVNVLGDGNCFFFLWGLMPAI